MRRILSQDCCTEINSIGLRCAHRAVRDGKCGFHARDRRMCAAILEDGSRCGRMPMVGSKTCPAHVRWKKLVADDREGRPPEPAPLEQSEDLPFSEADPFEQIIAITDAREFAKAVLESREFREYIVEGLRSRDLSPTVIIRLMDYAEGWGKPPERVEHTGKDGQPIVTEVRRVVIRVSDRRAELEEETVEALPPAPTTH